jgi:DNA-directed RNA polymerase specialized sigma24 family protein
MATHRTRLLALNDPGLAPYLTAEDECTRGRQLERILTEEVQPRVRAVVSGYVRSDWPIEPHDVDDIVGQVTLRLLRKLRAATVLEEESVQSVEAYVTTLTKNAVRDVMRSRSPARTRLKGRLRYLFLHDRRLALWRSEGVTLCGLIAWKNRGDHETALAAVRDAVWSAGGFSAVSADAMAAAVARVARPVRLTDLVSVLAGAEESVGPHPVDATPAIQRDALEARQYLQVLWREIRELPPKQRAALLLNLREPGSGNAVTLLVAVGVATLDEIAEAVEMSRGQLRAIWHDLPLSDLRVAEQLGVQRQQVINLRKSARERLARRMAVHAARRHS